MKITFKNQEDFLFGLLIVGGLLLWFAFVAFAPESPKSCEYVEWKSNESAMPSSGMDY